MTTIGQRRKTFALALLFAINFMNFYDRQVLGAIGEKIKVEWLLSDGQLAGLTTAFVLLYAVVGIPLGRLADSGRRHVILGAGVIVWSAFTGLSGTAGSFLALCFYRLGVGVGEASAAPTGNSLIGDLFPPERRARAISVFMLGLPFGTGASYLVSGLVAKATGGWRPALFVAAVPGFVLGVLAFLLPSPARGQMDSVALRAETLMPLAPTIRRLLAIPTMRWIIVSGALFNLNIYALAAFNTSYMIRYHGLDIDYANRFSGVIYGAGGGIGMVLGGWMSDRVSRHGRNQRMRLASLASLATAPLVWWALLQPRGDYWWFGGIMFVACLVLYMYYASVYATIQDIVEARARGTAMAVYFFVFYLFTAVGLLSFGRLSDALAARAIAAGASAVDSRALGLHGALYVIPVVSLVLVGVLWAGSRSVVRDAIGERVAARAA